MITNTHKPIIDNVSYHETPEGVLLTLIPVGIMPRLTAFIYDFLIKAFCVTAIYIPLALIGDIGMGLYAIVYFLVEWLYPVYFEVFKAGQTPGKKTQDIYVCHDDGTQISMQSSMIRNLLRVADFLPMLFVSAAISMLYSKKSQRIGDILAGTIVVYKQQDDIDKVFRSVYGRTRIEKSVQQEIKTSKDSHYIDGYDKNSPLFTFSLTHKEQQSLLGLSDRLLFLPILRQHEITEHLSPLVITSLFDDKHHKQAVYDAVTAKSQQIRGGL